MDKELPSYNPSNQTVATPLTSLLYDQLRTAKGLTTTEKLYAQIEKEYLANPTQSLHRPPTTFFFSIFKKDLTLAPKFLQRILFLLQRYDFTVVYRKGSLLHLADTVCMTCSLGPHLSGPHRYHSRATTQCHIIMHLLQH